jgi:hypothetical protein
VVAHAVPIVTGARSVQQLGLAVLHQKSKIIIAKDRGTRRAPCARFRDSHQLVCTEMAAIQKRHHGRLGGNRRKCVRTRRDTRAQRPPRPLITCSALCCCPNPGQSLVRIGVSKTGFTGLSTPVRHEDKTRNRDDDSAYNLVVLGQMAFNLMRRDRSRVSLRSKFNLAAWNGGFVAELLSSI